MGPQSWFHKTKQREEFFIFDHLPGVDRELKFSADFS